MPCSTEIAWSNLNSEFRELCFRFLLTEDLRIDGLEETKIPELVKADFHQLPKGLQGQLMLMEENGSFDTDEYSRAVNTIRQPA